MGRAPCCDKANVKKGPWSPEEDAKLKDYIEKNGTGGNWIALPQKIGLKRCGKSCRLRWLNYLRPNIKHGGFSVEEDNMICSLYMKIGSRWSIIAAQLPGRTDNDIKNYWNTKLKSKLQGKQRKQHRPRPRKNSRQQEANSGTQNLSLVNPEVAINQTAYNYLPQLSEATLVMPPARLDQSFDYAGTANRGAATTDILMQELKGTRFHEDLLSRKSSISIGIQCPIDATLMQEYGTMATNPSLSTMMQAVPVSSQIFMSSSTVVTSDCNQMISSTWPDMNYHQQVPNMFPGLEDEMFNENLHTLGEVDNYNCNHSNNGVMESWLYYGSSSGNSCSISTDGESNISWEDLNSSFVVNYPSMLADGSENCRGGFGRSCTFEDQSRYLGPQ